MNKISFELQQAIKTKPSSSFDIIITLHDGSNPSLLHLKAYTQLMDSIIAAKLNAEGIQKLAMSKHVISIEMDAIMTTQNSMH